MVDIADNEFKNVGFVDAITYELYEGMDCEQIEVFSDIDEAMDTYDMSMSKGKLLVEVKTTRLIMKP